MSDPAKKIDVGRTLLRDVAIAGVVLLGLEIAAQIVQAPSPHDVTDYDTLDGRPPPMLEGSPFLLWELTPGDRGVEGGQAYINSLGMRDRERPPKQRARAIALGDSSVFGFGVDDAEIFTAVLESRVDADFINAGVYGYSSAQAHNLMDMRGWDLEPDLLIVATLWSDNNFDSFIDEQVLASYAETSANLGFQIREVMSHSGLFRWMDYLASSSVRDDRALEIQTIQNPQAEGTGERRVPIATYAANLERFCQAMHDRGGGVLFLMLANREDFNPRDEVHTWVPYRDVMRAVAARWDAPLVEVTPVFAEFGGEGLFIDEIHPNQAGHRLMGEAIERALVERGWPGQPLALTPPTEPLPSYPDPYAGRGLEFGLTGDPNMVGDTPLNPAIPPGGGPPPPGPPGPPPDGH